jgi:hypothetical protein
VTRYEVLPVALAESTMTDQTAPVAGEVTRCAAALWQTASALLLSPDEPCELVHAVTPTSPTMAQATSELRIQGIEASVGDL